MNEFNNYMRTKQRQALRKLLVELSIIAAVAAISVISALHIYKSSQLISNKCTEAGGYVESSPNGYICIVKVEVILDYKDD